MWEGGMGGGRGEGEEGDMESETHEYDDDARQTVGRCKTRQDRVGERREVNVEFTRG